MITKPANIVQSAPFCCPYSPPPVPPHLNLREIGSIRANSPLVNSRSKKVRQLSCLRSRRGTSNEKKNLKMRVQAFRYRSSPLCSNVISLPLPDATIFRCNLPFNNKPFIFCNTRLGIQPITWRNLNIETQWIVAVAYYPDAVHS